LQDLNRFIDESPDGVIYFSMGSILHSSNMKTQPRRRSSNRSQNWSREFCGSGRPTRYRDSRATWSYTNGCHSPIF